MVGTDNTPEMSVGVKDNLINWLEELPPEKIFGKGILVGLIVGFLICLIIVFIIKSLKELTKNKIEKEIDGYINDENDTKDAKKEEITNEPIIHEEINDPLDENNKGIKTITVYKICIFFAIIAFMIFIGVICSIPDNNQTNNGIFNSSVKATREDLYIEAHKIPGIYEAPTYYLKIQANSKIEDLVLQVKMYSNSGELLLTQELEIAKLTPGNEYKYELSINGINPSKIDKISKFQYKVLEGIIVE